MKIFEKYKIKAVIIYFLLLLSSLILLLLFNGDSPLYFFNIAPDNTVYKVVAKRMLRGDILYKDIYEHKGLYLYFYYMIKEFINPFLVEYILDICFVYFAYRSLIIFESEKYAFFITLFINVVDKSSGYLYHFGGQSETIGKAIIMLIIFLVLKNYYVYKQDTMKLRMCFVAGLLTMVLFMIKYTMTVFVLAFAIALCISCIKRKKIKQLLKYCGVFLAGFFTGAVPALIYFIKTDSFKDFWKIYIFDVSFKYEPAAVNVWPIVFIVLIILVVLYAKKKDSTSIDMLVLSCTTSLVFTAVATRAYYFGVCIPFLVIIYIALNKLTNNVEQAIDSSDWTGKMLAWILYIGVLIALPLGFSADMGFMTEKGFSKISEGCDGSLNDVVNIINESEDKSFLSRTDNCIIYLMTNTLPDTKYFINYNMVLEQHTSAYALSRYKEKNNYVNQAFNQYIDEGTHKYILQYACNYINYDLYEKAGTFCSNGNYGKKEIWILYQRKDVQDYIID